MVMSTPVKSEARTIPAGEFKAKCLQLMDEVKARKLQLIVTKRGEPVVQIGPAVEEQRPFRSIVGRSPAIKIPDPAEWIRLKRALADDWSTPADKLARIDTGKGSARKRRT